MHAADVAGIAAAQRLTRAVIHDVADTVKAGDTERAVAERIEAGLLRAGVRVWFHTPYAWFGERTRFAGFHDWEPDALPTGRRLEPGEPFILDAAPYVDGHPSDYAFSGVLDGVAEHARIRAALHALKGQIVQWVRAASDGKGVYEAAGAAASAAGLEVVHSLYPGAVLGHQFDVLPSWLQRLPRIGWGFQLPLIAGYALALLRHRLAGAAYPLINPSAKDKPRGIFAVEPHLASGSIGAKFESILVVDGDETRWLDPELFGEVQG